MRHILSRAGRKVLQKFARSRLLVAFDYDGTLAPIVRDPERAAMRKTTRELVNELATLRPCIVITGRTRADAMRRLSGLGIREVIGNHGLEPWRATRGLMADVRHWSEVLEHNLAALQRVKIENKTYSIAVHYRMSRDKKRARAAITRAARSLGRVRLVGGKMVVNLVPAGVPHKGIALERERARLKCDTAIYIGDDETDEDVFTLDQPARLLAIRVGRQRESAASYYLRNQREVDDLLQVLIRLRGTRQGTTLRPPRLVAVVRKRLQAAENPIRAEGARAYFKTNEELSFYGIDATRLREIERGLCGQQWKTWAVSDAVEFCDILIRDAHLEAKTVGMLTLARYRKSFEPSLLRRIERWLGGNHCANWATTDELSSRVIAPLIQKWPRLGGNVEHWTLSRNLWLRRAAAVSFVPCARRGERLDAAYRIATSLLGDREDLIHKATGWLLREAGKTDPVRLERYLLRHGPGVPRTTLRYAIERFPPARRRRVLVSTRPR